MPTNDEIIDKYDLEGDGDLGIEVNDAINEARTDTANQIFAELDNLHIVENWSTQKGKGVPLLLKQIGAYKDVKKKFGVLK